MLNKKQPTIKFTAEWPKTQVNFLDVTVSLGNGNSKTDLNVKSTDAHQYLHSSSWQPFHCKKGIPCSQKLRLPFNAIGNFGCHLNFTQLLDEQVA